MDKASKKGKKAKIKITKRVEGGEVGK